MATTQKYAGSGANNNVAGTTAWSAPANITVADALVSTATGDNESTQYLEATNFGFSIPSTSVVDGVLAEFNRLAWGIGSVNDLEVLLITNGTHGSQNKSTIEDWPEVAEFSSHGGSDDLWGESLSYEDVNASDFGVTIRASISDVLVPEAAMVESVRMTLFYHQEFQETSDSGSACSGSSEISITNQASCSGGSACSGTADCSVVLQETQTYNEIADGGCLMSGSCYWTCDAKSMDKEDAMPAHWICTADVWEKRSVNPLVMKKPLIINGRKVLHLN